MKAPQVRATQNDTISCAAIMLIGVAAHALNTISYQSLGKE